MSDLTEFLLARIAEDEAVARSVADLRLIYPMGGTELVEKFTHARLTYASEDGYPRGESDPAASSHFSRHEPARVLRECEAKRKLLGLSEHGCGDDYLRVQSALALPYADHPDFRDEWR